MGRRGDGSDGHCWAGGLGALLDGGGDDVYTAGNWAMGTSYWFGIGLLHDRAGDDEYRGVAWVQGSGAHFCISALVDEAGDDKHLSEGNTLNSLAFGHDFSVALLLNAGGNDVYEVGPSGLAYSINRSVAMLLDLAGDDTYRVDAAKRVAAGADRPGFAQNNPGFRARGVSSFFAQTTSVGLFLDIGGRDAYWEPPKSPTQPATQPAPASAPVARYAGRVQNDAHWLDAPESPNWADRNFSVGVDRADGEVELTPAPVRRPSGPARTESEKVKK
ncbi:MAG: hypothetical protein AB1716_21925, partial [Planctomycetota bacterium]